MLGRRFEISLTEPNYPAPIYLRLGTSDVGFYDQIFRLGAYDLPLTRSPRVIVDAGANIGLTSRFFAARYPQARILALEPESSNFAMLRRNTAAYPRIVPIQAALWDSVATLDVIDPSGRHGAYRTQAPVADNASSALERVLSLTMPKILADYALDYIDLLKIDIEGAEKELFAVAEPWIGRVGVIIAELHDHFRRGCALSFYAATRGFDLEWHTGEHIVVARRDWMKMESEKWHKCPIS
jgi:FkbM family methyltransferase